MNVVKIEHQCGTWNLWNLFPHNILGICKYMLLNIYSELCYLDTLETWGVKLQNIKSMEKGSTGSTLILQLTFIKRMHHEDTFTEIAKLFATELKAEFMIKLEQHLDEINEGWPTDGRGWSNV